MTGSWDAFFRGGGVLAAYRSSRARNPIGAVAASQCYSHSNAGSEPRLAPQLAANAGSLTHWGKPGIKLESSWIRVGFLTCWATVGTPPVSFDKHPISCQSPSSPPLNFFSRTFLPPHFHEHTPNPDIHKHTWIQPVQSTKKKKAKTTKKKGIMAE